MSSRRSRDAVKAALLLLFVGFVLLCQACRPAAALVALILWYTAMSGADWALHRYVLHGDPSPIKAWRHAHWVHHREFDGAVNYQTGASLTFPHASSALIALSLLPVALVLGLVWTHDAAQLVAIAIAHLVAVTFAVGMHNYAHSAFHRYRPPRWSRAPCVPVPSWALELLHEHHERHHANPCVNLCTVLLGFDWLAGTTWTPPPDGQRPDGAKPGAASARAEGGAAARVAAACTPRSAILTPRLRSVVSLLLLEAPRALGCWASQSSSWLRAADIRVKL